MGRRRQRKCKPSKVPHIAAVDSAGGAHPEAIAVVQRFIEALHTKAAVQAQEVLTSRRTVGWRGVSLQRQTPQQPDAVSCGVYMLFGIWCRATGADLATHIGSVTASYLRDRLVLCLYTGSCGRLRELAQRSQRS